MNIGFPNRLKNTQGTGWISVYSEKLIIVLIGTFIFFNPFPHTTTIKEICFYLSVAIVISLIILKKTDFSLKSPLILPFALYILWAFASIFWAVDRENTVHDFYAHLLKYIVVYYLLINYYASEKRLNLLTWIVIISTSIFTIKGMVNFYIVMDHPISARLIPADRAPINSSAIVALFTVFLSILFLKREKNTYLKLLLSVCLTGTLLATILSYSRGVLLALIISTITLFFLISKDRKKIIVLSILIAIAVGALYSTSPWFQRLKLKPLMSNYRFVIYYTSFEIFKDYPIIGVGFGMKTFEKHMWHQYNPKVPRKWQVKEPAQTPHSFFFSILVRLGIVGTAIFGFILVKIFHMNMILLQYKKEEVRNWGAYLLVSFIGMLISGLFGSILHGAAAYNVYIVLAMITVVWQSTQNPRNHSLHYSRKDILARP